MKVTIIGIGNVGLIHAPYFINKGHEVTLLKSSNLNMEMYNKISEDNGYKLKDINNNVIDICIDNITLNFETAISSADLIFVATTTLQHESIAKRIAPFAKDGQIICLMPSYASSYTFKNYIDKKIKYAEFETTVYNGRIIENNSVNITFENCRVAAYFDNFTDFEKKEFSKSFFKVDLERNSSLEIAFHNPNMIVHTIGMVMSASRIEYSKGEFWMYKEAFTPSVINLIYKFDEEKNKVLEALGCKPLYYFDAAKWRNEENLSQDSLKVFKAFSEEANKGPSSLNHRYLLEDIPKGLVLFEYVGEQLNISTPIASSIINIASGLLGIDFRENRSKIKESLIEI